MCGITYITLSYYVTFLTYIYNSCKYIYKKISLSLILFIVCNALRNFVQPFAYKGVYSDLLQPRFQTFRTYAGRVYHPFPWASRTLVLLVMPNWGYFQTIRIYDFRILGIADTSRNLVTVILQLSYNHQSSILQSSYNRHQLSPIITLISSYIHLIYSHHIILTSYHIILISHYSLSTSSLTYFFPLHIISPYHPSYPITQLSYLLFTISRLSFHLLTHNAPTYPYNASL